MASLSAQSAADTFAPLRPALVRVAYRMLGSVADAEDVVQDAFLRWLDTDRQAIREPEAFLRRVVTRLCLDVLKSARRQREVYPGVWLPEPVLETDAGEIDDVTLPLLMALERLSPLERAAFLLHDVFGLGFDEVAASIGRDAAACRQLASRARAHVRAGRPRYPISRQRGLEIAEAFYTASRQGDMAALRALLAGDVTVYADGGGKKPSARGPIAGLDAVLHVHEILARIYSRRMSRLLRYGLVNGLPGFVTVEPREILQTTALEIVDGKIAAIYAVRNPDKLRHLEADLVP